MKTCPPPARPPSSRRPPGPRPWPLAALVCAALIFAPPPRRAAADPPEDTAAPPSRGGPDTSSDTPSVPAVETRREIQGTHADVVLAVDWATLGVDPGEGRLSSPGWNDLALEQMVRRWLELLRGEGVRSLRLLTPSPIDLPRVGVRRGQLVPLNELLPEPEPVPRRPWEAGSEDGGEGDAPPRRAPPPPPPPPGTLAGQDFTGQPAGALSGKIVYLSQGHGWYWSSKLGRWATQRGNTHDIVEDFVNAEGANHYLVPLLRNAGATVITAREHDPQRSMAIVDDADPKPGGGKGGYAETGSWSPGTAKGFASGKAPYKGALNPFALGGYRAAKAVQGKPTATATFVPAIPGDGRYAVYVGYTAGSNRVADAHFEIRHAGGISHRRVDMRRHGQTWTWLGSFRFRAGVDPTLGAVLLHNDTAQGAKGKVVIADVVRFGGGEGLIVRGDGKPPAKGPTSGRPRWEECARYNAQYAGAPPQVWDPSSTDNADDVTTRSRFAAWHRESGEDAIFLSWHTNAPSPARGTSTFVYGPNGPDGSYNFTGTKGSDKFAKLIQKITVADIRAAYDPKWKDRGVYSAWFGELNPKNNPEMPAALVEAAFHSTKEDADLLRQPRFRHLLARSFYKAIVRYFAERDGLPVELLPEPVRALRMEVIGPDTARVSWQPGPSGGIHGDPPTHYVLQRSADGRAFGDGVVVKATSAEIDLDGPGVAVFVRVLAVNAGGMSLPSATLGAAPGCGPGARALFVQGFTRMSAGLMPVEDLSVFGLKQVQRLRPRRMNTFDYAVEHIEALAAGGISVDAVAREALDTLPAAGPGSLASYALLDWAAGEQSTADVVFTAAERKALAGWLQGGAGRALLASGAEIAWAVDHKGSPASGDWLATWFGARFAADDAGVYGFEPAPGSGTGVPSGAFDDGKAHSYDVNYPDVLKLQGAQALLVYAGGKGVAGTLWKVGGARTALIGFPLETVHPAAARLALTAALLDRLGLQPETWPCPQATAEGGDASGGDDAGATDGGEGDGGPWQDGRGRPQVDAGPAALDASAGPADVTHGAGLDAAGLDTRPPPLTRLRDDDGCGCRLAPGEPAPGPGAAALLAALWGAIALRRRRPAR